MKNYTIEEKDSFIVLGMELKLRVNTQTLLE